MTTMIFTINIILNADYNECTKKYQYEILWRIIPEINKLIWTDVWNSLWAKVN